MIGSTGANRRSAGCFGATAAELECISVQGPGSRVEVSGFGRLAQRGRGKGAGGQPHAGRRPPNPVGGAEAKAGFAYGGGAAGRIVGHPDEIRFDRGQVNDTACHNVRMSRRRGAHVAVTGLT
jgi:hypothetical protein